MGARLAPAVGAGSPLAEMEAVDAQLRQLMNSFPARTTERLAEVRREVSEQEKARHQKLVQALHAEHTKASQRLLQELHSLIEKSDKQLKSECVMATTRPTRPLFPRTPKPHAVTSDNHVGARLFCLEVQSLLCVMECHACLPTMFECLWAFVDAREWDGIGPDWARVGLAWPGLAQV